MQNMKEIDLTIIKRASYIVVYDIESAKEEAGELISAAEQPDWSFTDIYGELADLDMNDEKIRTNDKEITFFKSVGTAYFDLIIGCGIYNKAIDRKSTRLNSSHVAISYAVFCLEQ